MTPEPMVAIPSAPVMPSQVSTGLAQTLQPDMVSTVASLATDSGELKYKLPGQRNSISAQELQVILNNYENVFPEELKSTVSPKISGTNDYAGILVYKCIGAYRGDEYCIKCPLRKTCITRR